MSVRLILASNVKFESTIPLVDSEISLHKTFMDTLGRTTLKLTAFNLVDQSRDGDVLLSYDYTFSAAMRKPLTIFASVLSVFFVAWAIGNVDVSIAAK